MYPNQQPQSLYTTRHYNYNPQQNTGYSTGPPSHSSGSYAQPYPYYTGNPAPTSVTYVNDRSNYQQAPQPVYVPPNSSRSQSTNYYPPGPSHMAPVPARGGGGGGIEKTNMMSHERDFRDPVRPHEHTNSPRTVPSITAHPKTGGAVSNSMNLSEENPFQSVYGGYHYPSQIDPNKRITTQNTAPRSTENKSLNLSDESPFFSTYGRYHYPSQIDPQKRITEMPKAAGPLMHTNNMSNENPFSGHRPPPPQQHPSGGYGSDPYSAPNNDWNRNNDPGQASYRSMPAQRPPPTHYDQPSYPPARAPSPPRLQRPPSPPTRVQAHKPASSGPMDKTSMNMSPDNPFASDYSQYHYPSPEEVKAQKRSGERNARFAEQQPPAGNRPRPPPSNNQMTEYPETAKSDVTTGKGNSKFTSFEVNF